MIPPLPVLFIYPLVALLFFATLPRREALISTLILGYLFLPSQISYNLPVLPNLQKDSISALAALLGLIVFASRAASGPAPLPGLLPKNRIILVLFTVTLLSGFMTVLTNTDRQVFGPTELPGLSIYSGFSWMQGVLIMMLPMLMARKYLADEDGHKLLLKLLALAGALYSLPVLFEIIMSPQLNRIVYGYFPHQWKQHVRGDGFRPVVFLKHGLWLGVFMCCALLAAFAYMRVAPPAQRPSYLLLGVWLFFILMACRVIGAFGTALLLLPVMLFFGARFRILMAAAVAGGLLLYPVLRATDTVPVYQFADQIERLDPKRASSFRYRLINEDVLMAHANDRPLFGWGGFNRGRVFDERGRDTVTTDGFWILLISERGWIGYFALVGLLTLPTVLLARRKDVSPITAGLCLVLAANLINLVPNAALTPITWLIAGALAGRLERQSAQTQEDDAPAETAPPRYSRFAPEQAGAKTSARTLAQRGRSNAS